MIAKTTSDIEVDPLTARDYALQDEFLRELIADDRLKDEIPNGAVLVLLPDNDPELVERNIAFGVLSARRGKNVYFRHVHQTPVPEAGDADER